MILGPDNRRAALRVDSSGRLLVRDSVTRYLKGAVAVATLTGGSAGVETLMLTVPLGTLMANYRTRLTVNGAFLYTLNTNNKTATIKIGETPGTAAAVWARTRNSATNGLDAFEVKLQRNPNNGGQIVTTIGNNANYYGHGPINSATLSAVDTLAMDNSLNLYFFGTLAVITDAIALDDLEVEAKTYES